MSFTQLALAFRLNDYATFASFLPADNQQVIAAVQNLLRGSGEQYIYLFGPMGSGRSHLLQAVCHAAPEVRQTAVYLPLENPGQLNPDFFQGLEHINIICIDDVDKIAGNKYWEEQLFHLYNRARANNTRILIAGETAPQMLKINLPDLKSRLAWGVAYQLHALNDEQKLAALQLRAHSRGLNLDPTVGKFLLRRCPRNLPELFTTLEQLDQASLASQRRLTIPFVKEVLGV